ncbi:LuxR family transcriptional regulator [Nocardioides sp. W7]|uniref:helix-turn-helix transcriptional regulator n=1 Tax=Nocardioides sp. W7 TaxID=2931390 RepID=UPI001FD20F65|nr:LuxR family transcriptional regulator [Nocardioides sp. W7]
MSEAPHLSAPAEIQLDRTLLEAKFVVPQPRRGSVCRAAVIDPARSSGCRVAGVTAPAGYGKTTLLAQWAQIEDRRVAWVSLDRYDDDPTLFLTLLAYAFTHVSRDNSSLVADVGGLCVDALGRAAPRLASAFRSSPEPFVLIVDDLHELRSPTCHDALDVVIAGVPQGSQFVAASRADQPHLARLRASGDAIELGGGDLAMDVVGAQQVFAEADVGVSAERAAVLTERTEGWPAGLYLAAMIARHDRDGVVSGDDRYVSDYLYRESMMLLPKKVQRFLRRTAVLDQLCAPLCDAVLGEVRGQERLRALESSNSFLVPLDGHREWYRYHGLYREFLLGELRRVEPDLVGKLHLRAADWYEANGSPVLAVEHLLDTAEQDRSIQLITELALPTLNSGNMSTVQQWLVALGDPAIEGHPPLAVMAGWVTALTGETTAAERWAAVVDAATYDPVPVDGSASFESGRAMLRAGMCAHGPEEMMSDASFSLGEEPPWSPWRDTAVLMSAHAHLLAGDTDTAGALFAEAAELGHARGNTNVVVDSEAELALLAIDHGRWAEATERAERALSIIHERRTYDYAVSVLAFAVAGRLALRRGDLDEAERQLTRAMRARPSCTFVLPFFAVRVRLQLAKAHTATGDLSAARHLLREIDEVLKRRPALGALVDQISELRETVAAHAQLGATGAAPLTGAELRVLPYLQTHLTIAEIGERLFVSRNTVSSEVTSIYRKLGVSSRNEAVERATVIGLLGG